MLASVGGLAVAVTLAAGVGVASAASTPVKGAGPASAARPGHDCHRQQRWDLSGSNEVKAVYQGTTYTYPVTFSQSGSCLSGTLTDPYYPTTGAVSGTVSESSVQFSFAYPAGSAQGTRTFLGVISRSGAVSGDWSETGSEAGTGTFTLVTNARQRGQTQWSLSGSNEVKAVYQGTTYTYPVTFSQSGSTLTGTMTDPNYPTTGPVSGTVSGSSVTFSFAYPAGSAQGTRTFTGTISATGAVSGTWSETGSENASGTFTLATNAQG